MNQTIRATLLSMGEEDYKKFSERLIPSSKPLIGIRLGALRKFAATLIKNGWEQALAEPDVYPDTYFEESMLRGFIIAGLKCPLPEKLARFSSFIPEIDNWSICDSVLSGFKDLGKNAENRALVLDYIQPLLNSNEEFAVRTALVILLDYFVRVDITGKRISRLKKITTQDLERHDVGAYTERILCILEKTYTQGRGASSGAAWLTCELFSFFPGAVYEALKTGRIQRETAVGGIRKIRESRLPSKEVKERVRGLL